MTGKIVELYSDADLARLERRVRRWRVGLLVLAAAALIACIVLAATAKTGTAKQMELAAIVVSTLAGWIVIYGSMFIVTAGRRELAHAQMLREEERTRQEGKPALTGQRVRIQKSIVARRIELRGAGPVRTAMVSENRAKALEKAGATAVYTVHGYVAAYEVAP